ncbi:MAG: alpha/beta hydrolase [Enterobacterales bacterium]|nr:alpha/beta hydrolase [Enterobacterales bacterium]
MIQGAVGQVEAILDKLDDITNASSLVETNTKLMAVCCHPHPQHGGAMGTKVIYTAARSLAGLGIPSLRFNFRGVGQSEGRFDEGKGEQQDLIAAVAWMRQQYPEHDLLLAGFSFGAYISALQATHLKAKGLILIAPPVGRMDFSTITKAAPTSLIIQGDEDELVEVEAVKRWVKTLSTPVEFQIFAKASHFFHGRLLDLRQQIEVFVSQQLF